VISGSDCELLGETAPKRYGRRQAEQELYETRARQLANYLRGLGSGAETTAYHGTKWTALPFVLSTNRDHFATRLIIVTKIMLFRLPFHNLRKTTSKFVIVRPLSQRRLNVELKMITETRPQLTVASEP